MALAEIVNRISEDARQEAGDVVRAAERSADDLRQEARVRAARASEQLIARGRAEAEAEAKTRLARARLADRDRRLAVKRDLVQRVLQGAVARLEALPDEEYAALLAREVKRAARGGERLVLGEADHPRLAPHLPAALAREQVGIEVAASTGEIEAGVLLLGERTRVEISARVLVESRADRLTTVASAFLFGEDDDAGRGEG
ncbi:MAG TPA: V-type ATP synthase subunit E family protein [Patescibacteria group bacterium]|nr:V-type ATP synthase subunit E family protein [Patescibacteria group bacterium]